jgi:two-component system, cell cycle sensor histidine kinase and response regulator CckA
MINAMEAIDHKGSIIISTRNYQVQEEEKTHTGMKSGRYAVLSLSDTGNGIAKEDLEHIFEPFYTKKKMGKSGTGLGLAVVWNSIQDHDGNIAVESSTQGTTFNLFFPATKKQISLHAQQTAIEDFRGRGESILVVDDEPQQLDITKRILENLNYSVLCVKSGEEAITYMEKGHADLILLDMIMDPGINGLKTYQQILQHHPGQKAIIVSGFAESSDVRMAQFYGAQEFLKKPFSIEELGKAVKDELRKNQSETFSR